MTILRLAWASLRNRRVAALLTIISIALSVSLLLGVEKLRRDARDGFASTISGTDLIVGARGGAVQLLLYSVFRIGQATNNISWASYQQIAAQPGVAWTVPISLGDSHRGYRVMGTSEAYFEHYRYAHRQALQFAQGRAFAGAADVVLGATVAREFGYEPGQSIVLAHGTGALDINQHSDHPFTVVGILRPTGTPVDRTLHVSLAGMEAMHEGWQDGAPPTQGALALGLNHARAAASTPPASITAFLIGLDRKTRLFALQRHINTMRTEPLQAIMPAVALQELWDLMRVAEDGLRIISAFVVVTSLLGMLTVILATLEARRREMAVLRAVGARLSHVAGLFVAEAGVLALLGIGLGVAALHGLILVLQPLVSTRFGIHLPMSLLTAHDLLLLGVIFCAALLVSLIPAARAFRLSLADGLSIRI